MNTTPLPPYTAQAPTDYEHLVDQALREDLGEIEVDADLTATWTVDADAEDSARITGLVQQLRHGV